MTKGKGSYPFTTGLNHFNSRSNSELVPMSKVQAFQKANLPHALAGQSVSKFPDNSEQISP